jgi:hypothetical protein
MVTALCPLCAAAAVLAGELPARAAEPDGPPTFRREHLYDTTVHPDDAAVNVRVAFNRWPDCTTLESAIADIFRLEGVADGTDEEKALALWKWWRILVSATGGGYVYEEGRPRRPVTDPHKILTVYGHHQCDGQSWSYVALWRAAGYFALDQCHWGHTIASLWYRDHDGKMRFHDFDPQRRYYCWDAKNRWVGTWTNPLLHKKVHRHVMQPQKVHSGHTSLRLGESRDRRWQNAGHLVPPGNKKRALTREYYRTPAAARESVHAACGEEVHVFEPTHASVLDHRTALFDGSENTAATKVNGRVRLHPVKSGQTASFVYRMPGPNVVADAKIEATLATGRPDDVARLLISWNGRDWTPVFRLDEVGGKQVTVDVGYDAWASGRPNVYTRYTYFVKAELRTAGAPTRVGLDALKLTAVRQLNKRTLPHLRPGGNVVRVTWNRIAEDCALQVRMRYRVKGEPFEIDRTVTESPHYFRVDVPEVEPVVLYNYDARWNDGALRMDGIAIRLVPQPEQPTAGVRETLGRKAGEAAFRLASPHPADMTLLRPVKKPETDVRQTNGFFPQAGPGTKKPDGRMNELIRLLDKGRAPMRHKDRAMQQWVVAEELGEYPAATDALIEALPRANGDLTLFLCKALARNPDRKMIPALLRKWRHAPWGSPGTRYIPDVLAAIGDRSVVPALVKRLPHCRFDFRLHIAYACGKLGGPDAEKTLELLANHDPLRAIREFAAAELDRLRAGSR